MKVVGLVPLRIYDLRYFVVSFWIVEGVYFKWVVVFVGYILVLVVLDRYGYFYFEYDDELVAALERCMWFFVGRSVFSV